MGPRGAVMIRATNESESTNAWAPVEKDDGSQRVVGKRNRDHVRAYQAGKGDAGDARDGREGEGMLK